MNKIVPFLELHLTIGKRIGIQGPIRFLILGFIFILLSSTFTSVYS